MRIRCSGRVVLAAMVCLPLASLTLAGCHSDNSAPLTATQVQSADRLGQIRHASGGDWEKLSAEDRDFLLKMANGNEHTARMLIMTPSGGAAGKGPGGGPMGMPPGAGKPGTPAGQ